MTRTTAKEIEKIYLNDVRFLRKAFKSIEHEKIQKWRLQFLKDLNRNNPNYKIEKNRSDCSLYTNAFTFITDRFIDKKGLDAIAEIAKHYKNYRLEAHENNRTIGITFFVRDNIDYGWDTEY